MTRPTLGITLAFSLGVIALCAAPRADARVTRFVVEQQRLFADGTSFGKVGQYERLDGTAYMEVSPRNPHNGVILNLDKAPRNERGMVEFSAPFFILKPVDMDRGNDKIYYVVNNRGNKQALAKYNYVPAGPSINNPLTAADAGDGFLMRLGYTVVDAGWQGDVAAGDNRLFPNLPVATHRDGRPIVAPVRIEYSDRTIPAAGTFTLTLEGSPSFTSYESADTDTAHSTLTVRDSLDGAKVPIASSRWAFGRCATGPASLVASTTDICLFDGFKADRLYELIYPAKNPKVMGLGYAVTRDIASFLRNQTHDDVGNPNPLAHGGRYRHDKSRSERAPETGISRVYGFGSSSTGMYMRDFLYLGFNEDERGRQVFDAVNIHIAGTHRLFANVEFADPNTYSRQDDRHDFLSTSVAPLTYAVRTDPISGLRDGILKRPRTDPLVIDTHTELEHYQFRASLLLHDGLGRPARIPDKVRIYMLSGFQHGGGNPPDVFPQPNAQCAYPTNPNYHGPTHRALLVAMDAWADKGREPPESRVPDVRDGTLVTLDEARSSFPAIPGVQFPPLLNELEVLFYGHEFDSEGGRLTVLPPWLGRSYEVRVPKPDKDGLDIAGIRPMEIRAPLGTNVGWNIRAPGRRDPNLCGLSGSYFPFGTTKSERLASGDPRKSLEERYGNHKGYVKAVTKAAHELSNERLLLKEDADRFIRAAEQSNVLR